MDAQLLPAPLADGVLDEVTADINELTRSAGLGYALQLGALLVTRLYGNSLEVWRSRGTADTSFRKLARREDLRVSKTVLHRSVQVYELYERLGRPDWKHLGVSHVAVVLALPHDKQGGILHAAESCQWTVRELRDQVQSGVSTPTKPAGFVRSIRSMERMLARRNAFADLDRVQELSIESARDLFATVASMRAQCEQLEHALAERLEAAVPTSGQ